MGKSTYDHIMKAKLLDKDNDGYDGPLIVSNIDYVIRFDEFQSLNSKFAKF